MNDRKKLQEKTHENPYFTLNYQENSGFPGFFPGVFFQERTIPTPNAQTPPS